MLQIMKDILKRIDNIKKMDIRYENLGADSNFIVAHQIKEDIVELQQSIIDKIQLHENVIPEPLINNQTSIINNQSSNLENLMNQVASLIGRGIHNNSFPQERKGLLNEFKRLKNVYIIELYPIKYIYDLLEIKNAFSDEGKIVENVSKSKINLEETQSILFGAKKSLGDIEDVSFVKSMKESAGTFEKLRNNHSNYSMNWFITLIISIVLTIASVYIILLTNIKSASINETIILIIKKVLYIGLPALLMRIAMRKYNIERNLKIIYDHRATVLEQLKYFENSIGDDKDAKNKFRMEIAKYIFADPTTGYISESSSSDLSVNPIINLAEQVAKKANAN